MMGVWTRILGSFLLVLLLETIHTFAKTYDDYDYSHQDPYNSIVGVKHVVDYYSKPQYAFGYEVEDYYNQLSHGRWEIRDGDVTKGQYRVLLPDGRIQIVSYIADKNGYQPTIEYIGKGAHPPPPPVYAKVKAPQFLEPVIPVPATPQILAPIHASPVSSAAGLLDFHGGHGKFNDYGGIEPFYAPATPVKVEYGQYPYGPGLHGSYAQSYGHADGSFYGGFGDYDQSIAASKVAKKRALLYDRTLFRKDLERPRRRVMRIKRKLIKKQLPSSKVGQVQPKLLKVQEELLPASTVQQQQVEKKQQVPLAN